MKVKSNGLLQLNVPYNTSLETIEAFIYEKKQWIDKKKQSLLLKPPIQNKCYLDGEEHLILGKSYQLRLIIAPRFNVIENNDYLDVYYRKNTSIKNQFKKWFSQQAKNYFNNRTRELARIHKFPEIKAVKVRYMKARWGSCSSTKEITFNVELFKYSSVYVDYVIIHELCHLIHLNHGPGFYKLQNHINPDWKRQKKQMQMFNASGAY